MMANSTIPHEIVIIAYYKRLIAILSLLLLALSGLVAWLISYNISMNDEFLKRLKTRSQYRKPYFRLYGSALTVNLQEKKG